VDGDAITELTPLRATLLADASVRAAAMLADARAEASITRASAEAEALRLVDAAREDGRRAAEAIARSERLAAARQARALVLQARSAREATARERALRAALAFRKRPEYGRLLEALETDCRRRLGAEAEIERDPAQGGGVRARLGSRSLDYTLPSLAEHALALALPKNDGFVAAATHGEPSRP
jgi:hypothetical protein